MTLDEWFAYLRGTYADDLQTLSKDPNKFLYGDDCFERLFVDQATVIWDKEILGKALSSYDLQAVARTCIGSLASEIASITNRKMRKWKLLLFDNAPESLESNLINWSNDRPLPAYVPAEVPEYITDVKKKPYLDLISIESEQFRRELIVKGDDPDAYTDKQSLSAEFFKGIEARVSTYSSFFDAFWKLHETAAIQGKHKDEVEVLTNRFATFRLIAEEALIWKDKELLGLVSKYDRDGELPLPPHYKEIDEKRDWYVLESIRRFLEFVQLWNPDLTKWKQFASRGRRTDHLRFELKTLIKYTPGYWSFLDELTQLNEAIFKKLTTMHGKDRQPLNLLGLESSVLSPGQSEVASNLQSDFGFDGRRSWSRTHVGLVMEVVSRRVRDELSEVKRKNEALVVECKRGAENLGLSKNTAQDLAMRLWTAHQSSVADVSEEMDVTPEQVLQVNAILTKVKERNRDIPGVPTVSERRLRLRDWQRLTWQTVDELVADFQLGNQERERIARRICIGHDTQQICNEFQIDQVTALRFERIVEEQLREYLEKSKSPDLNL